MLTKYYPLKNISTNMVFRKFFYITLSVLCSFIFMTTALAQDVISLVKKAEQGDANAQFNLALYYEEGKDVEKDMVKAIYWYSKSAEQGNADAQFNLALCYEYGKGVEEDITKAIYWYAKAAEQGDADSQINLGYIWETGKGVEKDMSKAIYWYKKASEQGEKA